MKLSETEILYGLFRCKSTEIECQTDGNFPEEKPPNTEDEKKPRSDILGLFIKLTYYLLTTILTFFVEKVFEFLIQKLGQ
jgi:hypothetical protein